MELRVKNHYIQEAYLRNWESTPGKVFLYQKLVSHENVPLWSERQINGIAYRKQLYSRPFSENREDEIERWFADEFESPAWPVIQNVINEERLTPDNWTKLALFLALHDLRTPARLLEHLDRYTKFVDKEFYKILLDATQKIEQGHQRNVPINDASLTLPLKITTEIKEDEEFGILKAETAASRASWLWAIEHQLRNTVNILHKHKWRIMHSAKGLWWFTTDKPVIRLNFFSKERYNFNGGWDCKGSEILMPLSPEHMLYTKVGHYPPPRGSRFSEEQTILLRRIIAQHAHRYVYANTADDEVTRLVTRIVDRKKFKYEEVQWERWHSEQTESEKYFFRGND
ncbi:DUF4238 domain-containing protein [Dyadobacter sp. LHD-138]|uniref:DUF4238 domain-containing protein n=1 Tax=Dyadobacter sp. LHD-138 TaxID=3071413 RepID=UPI0027E0F84E|nr:DUF4238 domain-containing protein [Dyadobacter sp. LHD-138]MDQ6479551.1 DUF4238 domain-containing protein [Dyadobacter sp. LHD-138]